MPRVTFEPIDEEIDCEDDETVLDAAFRQGFALAHGCREGQCSACKCYLLDGEVSLKRYSTFALSDTEESNGYTLLCRAMPDSDLTVELLHVPDDYRLTHEIRDGRATVTECERVTRDIFRLVVRVDEPADFDFEPGQYLDLHVPGGDLRRSFSMANLSGDGTAEFLVKAYEGGVFSGLLDDGGVCAGVELGFTGPYGAFRLQETDRDVLLVAGGSGMAPVLAVLRQLARESSTRTVRFFYGARTADDLFHRDVVDALGAQLADFAYTEVLSEPGDGWDGATGFVHEVAAAAIGAGEVSAPEVYTCGPPPMVDALTEELTTVHDVEEGDIHFDKFTTAAAGDD